MKLRQQETITTKTMTIDPTKYVDFVRQTTSQPSLDWPTLSKRLTELEVKMIVMSLN